MAPKKKTQATPELAGQVNEDGARFLEEVDLLRWHNSRLRIQSMRHQVEALRTRAENHRLTFELEKARLLNSAAALERQADSRERNDHRELVTDLGARYGVDFADPGIGIDDETGEIKAL